MLDDALERARRQEEAILRLRRDTRTTQPVDAHAVTVLDGVLRPRDREHMAQAGPSAHVVALLREVSLHAAARLAEPLRDVEDGELRAGPRARGKGIPPQV